MDWRDYQNLARNYNNAGWETNPLFTQQPIGLNDDYANISTSYNNAVLQDKVNNLSPMFKTTLPLDKQAQQSIMAQPKKSPMFAPAATDAPKEEDAGFLGYLKKEGKNFFGDNLADNLQATGSVLGAVGSVYDTVVRNKYNKKMWQMYEKDQNRTWDAQDRVRASLKQVWGKKDE